MSNSTAMQGMLYRTLGSTGEKVSAIGIGGWHNGLDEVVGACRGAMGIAARAGAQRLASRPCAQLGAHTSAHFSRRFGRLYSIKWKLLFNKLKHFSDRFRAVVSRRHSHPAIPIAPLHPPAIPIAPLQARVPNTRPNA